MRKITRTAVKHFLNNGQFEKGNTEIASNAIAQDEWGNVVGRNQVEMRLHGNTIACAYFSDRHNLVINFCGWPTPTTKERLNGLFEMLGEGRPFHTVDHQLMYDGAPISDSDNILFEFIDGRWKRAQ